jgi:mono/diheme cytochrome c family protein
MNRISLSSCVMAMTSFAMIAASSPPVCAATADAIKEGEETYADNCATCHGECGCRGGDFTCGAGWSSLVPLLQIYGTQFI